MDPFEEFEFKPLTDGLGFHKKKTPPKEDPIADTNLFSSSMANKGLDLLEETSVDPLMPPLPRKKATPAPTLDTASNDSSAAVNEILKTLQKNKHLEFNAAQLKNPSVKEEFKKSRWSFSAALLDGMLVIAASLLCMIILLVVTKVDLIGNLKNPDSQWMIYLSTASIFAGVAFIYLTFNRIYLGYTPGEWAFDQRVGLPQELNKASYSLKILFRSLITIATGFILLPLLSLIFNKDLAGVLSGAKLYKRA